MKWNRSVDSTTHTDPDFLACDGRFRRAHGPAATSSLRQIQQDNDLRLLRQETRELRFCVEALVNALQRRELISETETAELVSIAERLQRDVKSLSALPSDWLS